MIPVLSDGIAVYVFRELDGELQFLQLRRAHDDILGESWQPVYGGIREAEKAVDAARRELLEETGLVSDQIFLVEYVETFFFRPDNAVHMLPVFAARVKPEDVITINEEHTDFRWVASAEVNSKFMWKTQRQALAAIIETLTQFPHYIPFLEI